MLVPRLADMLAYLVLGATLGFAAAVQPGPLQTFLIAETAAHGWRRTLPAAVAPMLSDGPIALLVLVVLARLPKTAEHGLRIAGGLFLFYLAQGAWRSWREYGRAVEPSGQPPFRSLWSAVGVNLLNPNPYLGWSLVLGPLLLQGWRERPTHGFALLAAFYGTMAVSLAGIIVLFASASRFGPRVGRALVGLSALGLVAFACFQLAEGVAGLSGS